MPDTYIKKNSLVAHCTPVTGPIIIVLWSPHHCVLHPTILLIHILHQASQITPSFVTAARLMLFFTAESKQPHCLLLYGSLLFKIHHPNTTIVINLIY